jgi:hypothetical protein
MTETQNSKQLVFDFIFFGYWNLFVIWCLLFVICSLSGLGVRFDFSMLESALR